MPYDAEPSPQSRLLLFLERTRNTVAGGWCKKIGIDVHNNVCLSMAVLLAVGYVPDHVAETCSDYLAVINALGFPKGVNVVEFNDHFATTKEDVLACIDNAIARVLALA